MFACTLDYLQALSLLSQGLPIIHAFDKEPQLVQSFYNAVDNNSRSFTLFALSNRWFGYRLDLAASVSHRSLYWGSLSSHLSFQLLSFATALLCVILTGNIDPESAGLSLTYILSLGGMLQYTTRLYSDVRFRYLRLGAWFEFSLPTVSSSLRMC